MLTKATRSSAIAEGPRDDALC